MRKTFGVLLILILVLSLLSGCGLKEKLSGDDSNTDNSNNSLVSDNKENESSDNDNSAAEPVEVDFSATDADMEELFRSLDVLGTGKKACEKNIKK